MDVVQEEISGSGIFVDQAIYEFHWNLDCAPVDLHEGTIWGRVEPQKEVCPAQSFPTDMANLDGFVIGCSCNDRCQSVFEEEDMIAWLITFHQHRSDRQIDPFHAGLEQGERMLTEGFEKPVPGICSLNFAHIGLRREGARTRTHQITREVSQAYGAQYRNTLALDDELYDFDSFVSVQDRVDLLQVPRQRRS